MNFISSDLHFFFYFPFPFPAKHYSTSVLCSENHQKILRRKNFYTTQTTPLYFPKQYARFLLPKSSKDTTDKNIFCTFLERLLCRNYIFYRQIWCKFCTLFKRISLHFVQISTENLYKVYTFYQKILRTKNFLQFFIPRIRI